MVFKRKLLLPPAAIANSKKSPVSFFDGNNPTYVGLLVMSLFGQVGHHVLFGSTLFFLFFLIFSPLFRNITYNKFIWNGNNTTSVALSAVGRRLSVMSDTMSYPDPLFFSSFFWIFPCFQNIAYKMFVLNGNNPTSVAFQSCRIPYEWSFFSVTVVRISKILL